MLRWIGVSAVLFFILICPALSQEPFLATIYYLSDPGGPPLMTTCQGSTPLPDGRVIKIFWDSDSDGADATDPRPTLCNDPPLCENMEPPGSVNLTEFPVNGVSVSLGAGYFATETAFRSVGILPSPPRYYLRIYETDGTTILWTSTVMTLTGGSQEVFLLGTDWICGSSPQCVVRDEQE